jgi:hypothetical protein
LFCPATDLGSFPKGQIALEWISDCIGNLAMASIGEVTY